MTDITKRPGMLTTLSIFAIVLGALGVFSVFSGVVSIAFEDKITSALTQQTGKVVKVQKAMQAELKEKLKPWKPFTYGSLFLKAGVVGLLLFGGFKAYSMASNGRSLLLTAFIAGAVFEAISFYPMYQIQKISMEVAMKYQKQIMQAQQPPGAKMPADAQALMESSMKIAVVIGVLIAVGWIALKLMFYAFGIYYMRKKEIVALYEGGMSSDEFLEEENILEDEGLEE